MSHSQSLRRHPLSAVAVVPVAAVLTACASVPDVTVNYRPVQWAMSVAVVHTLTCTNDNQTTVFQSDATLLPLYFAGPRDDDYSIRLKDLHRFFADSDITLGFTDDGRLKSINQSTLGQGEALVKSAITAAAAVSAAPAMTPQTTGPSDTAPSRPGVFSFDGNVQRNEVRTAQAPNLCPIVRKYSRVAGNQLPQVSIVQTAVLSAGSLNAQTKPSKDQKALIDELKAANLDLTATVSAALDTVELQPIKEPKLSVSANEVPLRLQRMVGLTVKAEDKQDMTWTRSAPVPTTAPFVLPIPKAALFGKQSFVLVLSESGRISTLGYGTTVGATGALNAVTSAATAGVTADTAEAAALKAASDLIAQQQRFNTCTLNPSQCQ